MRNRSFHASKELPRELVAVEEAGRAGEEAPVLLPPESLRAPVAVPERVVRLDHEDSSRRRRSPAALSARKYAASFAERLTTIDCGESPTIRTGRARFAGRRGCAASARASADRRAHRAPSAQRGRASGLAGEIGGQVHPRRRACARARADQDRKRRASGDDHAATVERSPHAARGDPTYWWS